MFIPMKRCKFIGLILLLFSPLRSCYKLHLWNKKREKRRQTHTSIYLALYLYSLYIYYGFANTQSPQFNDLLLLIYVYYWNFTHKCTNWFYRWFRMIPIIFFKSAYLSVKLTILGLTFKTTNPNNNNQNIYCHFSLQCVLFLRVRYYLCTKHLDTHSWIHLVWVETKNKSLHLKKWQKQKKDNWSSTFNLHYLVEWLKDRIEL